MHSIVIAQYFVLSFYNIHNLIFKLNVRGLGVGTIVVQQIKIEVTRNKLYFIFRSFK
jgi:hypothetical protein